MAGTKVLVHKNPQFGSCPQCKSVGTLHRSRSRNMFEHIIRSVTIFKTYRCKECGWRGFRSTLTFTKRSVKQVLIYTALIIITALIARYFILNYVIN